MRQLLSLGYSPAGRARSRYSSRTLIASRRSKSDRWSCRRASWRNPRYKWNVIPRRCNQARNEGVSRTAIRHGGESVTKGFPVAEGTSCRRRAEAAEEAAAQSTRRNRDKTAPLSGTSDALVDFPSLCVPKRRGRARGCFLRSSLSATPAARRGVGRHASADDAR